MGAMPEYVNEMFASMTAVVEASKQVQTKEGHDPLAWAVDETVEAMKDRVEEGAWDITDLREYGRDMKEHGGELGRRIAKRVENHILKVCEEDKTCPECFSELMQGKVVMESRGFKGNERAFEPVVVTLECGNENCAYSEEL